MATPTTPITPAMSITTTPITPATDQQRIDIEIKLADALAERVLIDKVDKQGRPLIEHCRRVAATVKALPTSSHEQHIAALLHDIVEETAHDATPIFVLTLDRLFGRTVANLVNILTRPPFDETYERYIEHVALYPHARVIKLADLNNNLDETRGPIEPSLKSRYERARQLLLDVEREERERGEGRAQEQGQGGQEQVVLPVIPPKGNGK